MRRNGETVNKVEACHDCISRKNFTALCKRVERANHAGSRDTRFVPTPWKEEFRTAATFGVLIVYSRPDSLKKVFIKIYSYVLVLINRILNRVCYKRKKSWEWCRVRRTIWNRISIQLYKINRSEARVIFIDIQDNNCAHVIFAALPVASGVFLAIPEANFVPRVLSPTRRSVETGRRENLATRFSWREFCGSLFCFCSVFLMEKVRPFLSTFCTLWFRKYHQITNQKAKVLSYYYFYWLPLSYNWVRNLSNNCSLYGLFQTLSDIVRSLLTSGYFCYSGAECKTSRTPREDGNCGKGEATATWTNEWGDSIIMAILLCVSQFHKS